MRSFSLDNTINRRILLGAYIFLPAAYVGVFLNWAADLKATTEILPSELNTSTIKHPDADLTSLSALFGAPPQAEPKAVVIKESNLSLKLIASYVADTDKNSGAVLSVNGQRQRLYFIGDFIMPEVQLAAVQPRRILIKRSEGLEQITLRGKADAVTSTLAKSADDDIKDPTTQPLSAGNTIVENNEGLLNKLSELRSALHDAN